MAGNEKQTQQQRSSDRVSHVPPYAQHQPPASTYPPTLSMHPIWAATYPVAYVSAGVVGPHHVPAPALQLAHLPAQAGRQAARRARTSTGRQAAGRVRASQHKERDAVVEVVMVSSMID